MPLDALAGVKPVATVRATTGEAPAPVTEVVRVEEVGAEAEVGADVEEEDATDEEFVSNFS